MEAQMGTAPATSLTLTELDSELDEPAVVSCLARLQELHIALRALRETLPTLTSSVVAPTSSPEQLYSNVSRAAQNAGKNIKNFTLLMGEKRSREVFERVKTSRENDADGIGVWQVAEHPDWLEVKRDDCGSRDGSDGLHVKDEHEEGHHMNSDESSDEVEVDWDGVKEKVKRFEEKNTAIETLIDHDTGILQVKLAAPSKLSFEIEVGSHSDGRQTYKVKEEGKAKLHQAVMRSVNDQAEGIELGELLEMLASYSDLMTRPCNDCTRLLDRNGQFPVVRSRAKSRSEGNADHHDWDALHAPCSASRET